ncbi:hypothetical protein FHU28_002344 [Micromonospora echinospora]|uniref:Uncharacterized protein n=1 Tax=Micromonospora echinospora TaxID=1877 RepID=A0ABR6MCZ0_MICEC|nr:hypothetical protein [Micromonospora echinospora]
MMRIVSGSRPLRPRGARSSSTYRVGAGLVRRRAGPAGSCAGAAPVSLVEKM